VNDELMIYRGRDIPITSKIIVTQPELGQIEEFGEQKYFGSIYTLISVGADMKWQLNEIGIDYTKISDYELFYKLIWHLVSSKKIQHEELMESNDAEELKKYSNEDLKDMLINPLELVLKDIDFADFKLYKNNTTNEIVLYNEEKDITVDRSIYSRLVDTIRKMHGFKRNNEMPANEATRLILIEDAKQKYLMDLNKPYESVLKPLISALVNYNGFKYNHAEVWDLKINAFFDSLRRIPKIQDAQLLLQGVYSGFVNLEKIEKERLNWTGRIGA